MKQFLNKQTLRKFTAWMKTTFKVFTDNHCSMHAAGLTYFSMLAMVPILCILLLAAKTFHAETYVRGPINRQIDMLITNFEKGQDDKLAAIAVMDAKEREIRKTVAQEFSKQARETANELFDKVEHFDVGTLGWIGFIMLVWTIVSSVGMVEMSFNEIWEVAKPRPLWRRVLLYLTIVTIVPLVGALAMSVPIMNIVKNWIVATLGATWLTQWASIGLIWFLDSSLLRFAVAFLLAATDFALIFTVMPNCKVPFRMAWRGGAITAVLFGGWMKICAIAQVGIAKSSALYGSFAFFPIVLAWLYMSWQIILLGASMVRSFSLCSSRS